MFSGDESVEQYVVPDRTEKDFEELVENALKKKKTVNIDKPTPDFATKKTKPDKMQYDVSLVNL
jgi:hypothetical protein